MKCGNFLKNKFPLRFHSHKIVSRTWKDHEEHEIYFVIRISRITVVLVRTTFETNEFVVLGLTKSFVNCQFFLYFFSAEFVCNNFWRQKDQETAWFQLCVSLSVPFCLLSKHLPGFAMNKNFISLDRVDFNCSPKALVSCVFHTIFSIHKSWHNTI